ncbi:hypothetical protein [Salipaludibacillus daqingensis]|uniref:hypothetical protein n=1 Tax=Salipaludibacillus daqingensis TaxID=3041001 RepID=UPI00247658B7|nr:hypothetical protein [Salipaludibacillus daqingensis]
MDIIKLIDDYMKKPKNKIQAELEDSEIISESETENASERERERERNLIENESKIEKNEHYTSTASTHKTSAQPHESKILIPTASELKVILNEVEDKQELTDRLKLDRETISKLIAEYNLIYHSFIDHWSTVKEEELINEIVADLKSGITLYDLSKEFAINRKKRTSFVINLESKLKEIGYHYDNKNRNLTKKNDIVSKEVIQEETKDNKQVKEEVPDSNSQLDEARIISEVKLTKSVSKVAKKYKTTAFKIRRILDKENIRYDSYFGMWTEISRESLLREVAERINKGEISYLDASLEYGINSNTLNDQLRKHGVILPTPSSDQEEKDRPVLHNESDEVTQKEEDNLNKVDDSINESMALSVEDIGKIRKFMKELEDREENTRKIKSTIFISESIYQNLDIYAEKNDSSKSRVIEEALKEYLNKTGDA